MQYKVKFFGTEEELRRRLDENGLFVPVYVRGYALDNEVRFDVSEEEYYRICDALGDEMYSEEDVSISKVLVEFLKENHLVIATAESCTGGLVAARLVDVPGSSEVFYEGLVTYSNDAKRERLAVNDDTLETFGAVSEETAKEMAYGLLGENVDIGVSTTGIAGPGGGSEDKPVGLVYIGIAFRERDPIVIKRIYKGSRNDIRRCAMNEALYRTYKYLCDVL